MAAGVYVLNVTVTAGEARPVTCVLTVAVAAGVRPASAPQLPPNDLVSVAPPPPTPNCWLAVTQGAVHCHRRSVSGAEPHGTGASRRTVGSVCLLAFHFAGFSQMRHPELMRRLIRRPIGCPAKHPFFRSLFFKIRFIGNLFIRTVQRLFGRPIAHAVVCRPCQCPVRPGVCRARPSSLSHRRLSGSLGPHRKAGWPPLFHWAPFGIARGRPLPRPLFLSVRCS